MRTRQTKPSRLGSLALPLAVVVGLALCVRYLAQRKPLSARFFSFSSASNSLRWSHMDSVEYLEITYNMNGTVTKTAYKKCPGQLRTPHTSPPRPHKIVSGLIYNREEDLLYVRFLENYDEVDHFIIVESDLTFQGNPKPLNFKRKVCGRFAPFADKVVHVLLELHPDRPELTDKGAESWKREDASRDAMKAAIETLGLGPNDLILTSDTDEVPTAAGIREASHFLWNGIQEENVTIPVVMFECRGYYYSLYHHTGTAGGVKMFAYWASFICPFREIRARCPQAKVVAQPRNAGIHASYFFSPEGIVDKFKSFAHTDLNRPPFTDAAWIKSRIRENLSLWDNGTWVLNDPETDIGIMAFTPEARQLLLAQSRELRRLQET